jgi:hypothetical protein
MNKELIRDLAITGGIYDCITDPYDKLKNGDDYSSVMIDLERFAEKIIRECMAQCEQVAVDADAMAKSTFVTDAGRMLHEGMWGGAKNCAGRIKEHFGVEE